MERQTPISIVLVDKLIDAFREPDLPDLLLAREAYPSLAYAVHEAILLAFDAFRDGNFHIISHAIVP